LNLCQISLVEIMEQIETPRRQDGDHQQSQNAEPSQPAEHRGNLIGLGLEGPLELTLGATAVVVHVCDSVHQRPLRIAQPVPLGIEPSGQRVKPRAQVVEPLTRARAGFSEAAIFPMLRTFTIVELMAYPGLQPSGWGSIPALRRVGDHGIPFVLL